jgi:hypothetical protein
MFIFYCTLNLLLLITSDTGPGSFGETSFGGSTSPSSLLLLLSDELMIFNVDGNATWNHVFRAVIVCTTKLRMSRERNPGFVHRNKVIFR